MPKLVIAVTSNSIDRLSNFIKNAGDTENKTDVYWIIVANGIHASKIEPLLDYSNIPETHYRIRILDEHPRRYAAVMKEKIDLVYDQFGDDIDVFWNSDDDYVFNPCWADFVIHTFKASAVNYLTLLRYEDASLQPDQTSLINGFNMVRRDSSMGGCFGTRWKQFKTLTDEFFSRYGTGGMFDQQFWQLLAEKTGQPNNIWMPVDFGLAQHCNFISNYLSEKAHKRHHMYGFYYDPCCNPFELRG